MLFAAVEVAQGGIMLRRRLEKVWRENKKKFGRLRGWRFHINSRLRASVGSVNHEEKIVEVAYWVLLEQPEIAETALKHQIAHAMAGPSAGHGSYWKTCCYLVGVDPDEHVESVRYRDTPSGRRGPKWRVVCDACKWKSYRRRRWSRTTETKRCGRCGSELRLVQLR